MKKTFFIPRESPNTANLTVRSDPRILVQIVNNLQKLLRRRGKSSAPIARATGDFFANILRKQEG
ncbi:MAG: hypothetical protein IJ730_02565 [Alphaproteobacteria bacterium]|nr:hypothetical protein [Alphaproteobacteria bacterium]